MKKGLLLVLFSVMLLLGVQLSSVKALEPLDYWYSTVNKGSRFTATSIGIHGYISSNTMSEANFSLYFNWGFSVWDDVISNDFSYVSSDEKIGVFSITRAMANALNIPGYVVGATSVNHASTAYARYYKPGTRTVISFYNNIYNSELDYWSRVLLIWDTDANDGSVQTSDFTDEVWSAVSAHEIGHAIGYLGESTFGYGNIMSPDLLNNWDPNNPCLYPSENDILHISYFYSLE